MNQQFRYWDNVFVVKWNHYLSLIFGLSASKSNKLQVWHKTYVFFLCIFLSGWSLFHIYRRYNQLLTYSVPTSIVLDMALTISIAVASLMSVIYASFTKRRTIEALTTSMRNLENLFVTKLLLTKKVYHRGTSCTEFILFQIYVLCYILFDRLIFFAIGKGSTYNVVNFLNIYIVSIAIIQMKNYSEFLRISFMFFHKRIQEGLSKPTKTRKDTEMFLHIHCELCNLVSLINQIYGHQIVLLVLTIIVSILYNINVLVKFTFSSQNEHDSGRFLMKTSSFLNTVTFFLLATTLASTCDRTVEEIKRISSSTYRMLLMYPPNRQTTDGQKMREQLMLMAEHSSRNQVEFSAAGLFPVNYSMLFLIAGTATANVVILLQLN